MLRKNTLTFVLLVFFSFILSLGITVRALGTYDPTVQMPILAYNEARTVYLGNLARRDNGVPPLRWNRQLTYAARWFAWDSTENESAGFCSHQDSQGHWPDYRTALFGYLGLSGAENAFCGYVTPEYAIQGWMNSPGHRANLLDPNSREIGVGYYRRASDGRGYVVQDFGTDDVFPPVIIENEALATSTPNVNLYIYNRHPRGGFAGIETATQMEVSNNPYFEGASWEPYNANKAWTLLGGSGWRDVYVNTRDRFNRTLSASDSIYLGAEANIPLNEIGTGRQMSTTQSKVTLYSLNGGALSQIQLSLGWLADDSNGSFSKLWGNGGRVNDVTAQGGTAYRLFPGNGESFAWVYDTSFIQNIPMVAYFRLKVNDNTSSGEVARISVKGGPTEYGPVSLKGTDFTVANQYQEFKINFTFNPTSNDPFLIFQFWRSGDADLYVDTVTIFTMPQNVTSPLTWSVPGNNYRGQGIWVRYTNGTQFSPISEGITVEPPSHTISGNVAAAGVTLSYTDGSSKTAVSNSSGDYSLSASAHWSGTVTPTHPCFTFSPTTRSYADLMTNQAAQDYTPSFNNASGCADVNLLISGFPQGRFGIPPHGSTRASFIGINNGPVKILSTNNLPLIAAERIIYKVNNVNTSFSEMMALPDSQLDNTYWLPWYNNVDLDTQLRFANVTTNQTATVHVKIKGNEVTGCLPHDSPFPLQPGESVRVSCAGLNNGPVQIQSSVNIVAAERVIYKVNNVNTSFSEMMALPNKQLDNTYWLPWYNNADLDTQLRFGNVDPDLPATVHVKVGGVEVTGCLPHDSPFTLQPGESVRVSCAGLNSGPVQIQSDQNIVAAERVIYKANNLNTSFSEMMALPNKQLDKVYWLPWYNNVDLDTQLRFGNVDPNQTATVHVKVGGIEVTGCLPHGSPFTLQPGESVRVSCGGLNNGPVQIQSNVNIVAAERVIYKVNNVNTSFSEMMGLPNGQLSNTYWLPWYNNKDLDTQVRFGVP